MTSSAATLPDLRTAYDRDGFVLLGPDFLPPGTTEELNAALPSVLAEEGPRRVLERDGRTVRSVYGPHQINEAVARVSRLPQLLGAVQQLLHDQRRPGRIFPDRFLRVLVELRLFRTVGRELCALDIGIDLRVFVVRRIEELGWPGFAIKQRT